MLLVAGLGLVVAGQAPAQTFRILRAFNGDGGDTPHGGLLLLGSTLYGTVINGGSSGDGTAFRIDTNGGGFVVLHDFSWSTQGAGFTNADGDYPIAGLILSENTLYGTGRQIMEAPIDV
jgi:uncharacterized repeat protein (TIGR03803 family)